jgi:translocation and assembly module TamB
MDSVTPDETAPKPRRWRWLLWAVLLALVVPALLLAGLWLLRAPIAQSVVSDYLAAKGIAATYTIEQLDDRRLVLSNVVAGAAGSPDLTAQRITVDYGWGWTPKLSTVSLEAPVLRARVGEDGKVSLGALDALLPPPSDEPIALPPIDVITRNGRVLVETPAGPLSFAASSDGRLDRDFRAALRGDPANLAWRGVTAPGAKLDADVRLGKAITIDVKTVLPRLAAEQGTLAGVTANAALRIPNSLDQLGFDVTARAEQLAGYDGRGQGLTVTARGDGPVAAPAGRWTLVLASAQHPRGRAEQIGGDGTFTTQSLSGTLRVGRAAVRAPALPDAAGTPLAPLLAKLQPSLRQASGALSMATTFDANFGPRWQLRIVDPTATAPDDVRAQLSTLTLNANGAQLADATLRISGNGLPTVVARDLIWANGQGQALLDPISWRAADAALETSALTVRVGNGQTQIDGRARLSGPLGDGRVENLDMPLRLALTSQDIRLVDRCLPLSWAGLAVPPLRLAPARFTLCPGRGAPLYSFAGNGRWQIERLALAGQIGDTPAKINAARLDVALSNGALSVGAAAPSLTMILDRPITLRAPRLALRWANGRGSSSVSEGELIDPALPASVTGLSAQAAISASGQVQLSAVSALVRDVAARPRFQPLRVAAGQALVANGTVTGTADLQLAAKAVRLGGVTLSHDLGSGAGQAQVSVRALTFSPDLELFELTELARGVAENATGSVEGDALVSWGQALKASGSVELKGLSFATAALGPVDSISGRIAFDDLLALTTPPSQSLRIGRINPGIAIENGTLLFQLLPNAVLTIEGAQWPFSGGVLSMDPARIEPDAAQRQVTMRVRDVDVAVFLQQLDFKNLNATGRVEGSFPLQFDRSGTRIVGGKLRAQSGGGLIQYVGEAGQAVTGASKIAFDALKSFRYDSIEMDVDGDLAGELITSIRFSGINQVPVQPVTGGVASVVPVQASGLPFKFNIGLRAPFRSLLGTAERITNPVHMIQQAQPVDAGAVPGAAPTQSEPPPKS